MIWLGKRLWRLRAVFLVAVLLSSLPCAVSAQTKSPTPMPVLSPLVATSAYQGPNSNVRFTFADPAGRSPTVINLSAALLEKVREVYAGFWNPATKQMVLLAYVDGFGTRRR